jgi:dTDP-4-dehydrorhamnose 3,5-epimerase
VIFHETLLEGAYLIELERVNDERGWFARAWDRQEFARRGLDSGIVQCNLSFNRRRGTLRGLHYQVAPHAESKLIRCTRGRIYDVIVDLRVSSDSYLKWIGAELSPDTGTMLYAPKGFAHGYQTLEDDTEVFYQVTEPYVRGAEKGLRWDDPAFSIEWPIATPCVVSHKDRNWPDFEL